MRASPLLFASLLLFSLAACTEDTRPRGDGSITVDSSARDSRSGDGTTSDGGGDYGYCPGNEPGPVPACRIDADCECGACTLGSICGGVGCATECASNDDCTDGWCATGCCAFCVPACPDTPCPANMRCDEGTGHCNRIPCDDPEAAECPTNTRCLDGACQRLSCTIDADCDCGTCAQGRCYNGPGQCCPPLPG